MTQAESAASTRRRVVVDQHELAERIGGRLRTARLAAHLTQAQLAGDRYTKAYVSALEKGAAKPSMAALTYFSERLSLSPTHFLDDDEGLWPRLAADLALAAFRFEDGLIIDHRDSFDFWKWTRMALGVPGTLLGWSPIVQGKVRKQSKLLLAGAG